MSFFNEVKYALGGNAVYVVGFFVLLIVAFIFNAGYQIGYEKAFVPKSKACEEYTLKIAELESDLGICETLRAKEVLQCKTDCVNKVCRPLCIKDVRDAIDNYKKLRKCK